MIKKCVTVAAAVMLLGACDSTEPRVPTAVEVDQQNVSIETSDTLTLEATIVDQSGRPYLQMPTGYQITWSSSAHSIVSVSNGHIRGERPGQAIITAQAGDLEPAEVHVTVAVRTVTSEMSFQFSGHRNGTFVIDETFRLDQINWNGDWGFTWVTHEADDETGEIFTYQDVEAQRLRSDGKLDWIFWWAAQEIEAPGTFDAAGFFLYGFDPTDNSFETLYFGDGTVTFTSVASRQLAGTFSLGMGELNEADDYGSFTGAVLDITSGVFSVPLVIDAEIEGDIAADGMIDLVDLPERLRQLRAARR
jgi:hypothetical protein